MKRLLLSLLVACGVAACQPSPPNPAPPPAGTTRDPGATPANPPTAPAPQSDQNKANDPPRDGN